MNRNGIILGGGSSIPKNPTLGGGTGTFEIKFDTNKTYQPVAQTGTITFTKAATGNIPGVKILIPIDSDGSSIGKPSDWVGPINLPSNKRSYIMFSYEANGEVLVSTPSDWVIDLKAPENITGYPAISTITNTGFTVETNLNEEGTTYFVVIADGGTKPSDDQIEAGQDSTGAAALASDSIAVSAANTVYTSIVNTLTASTAYDIWVISKDTSGNRNTSVKLDATTTV